MQPFGLFVLFRFSRVCVFRRRVGRPLVLSGPIAWTGMELFCSQGTARGKVPLALTCLSDEYWESLDLFYYLDVFLLSCQRPEWNKLNSDTRLSEVPTNAHAGRRPVQFSSLLCISVSYVPVRNAIGEFSSGQSVISNTTSLLPGTLLSSYCEHCARPVQTSARSDQSRPVCALTLWNSSLKTLRVQTT